MGYIILNQPSKKKKRKRGKRDNNPEYTVHEYESKKEKKLSLTIGALFLFTGLSIGGILLYLKFKQEENKQDQPAKAKEQLNLKQPCSFFSLLEFTMGDYEYVYDYDVTNRLPELRNFINIAENYFDSYAKIEGTSSVKKGQDILLFTDPLKLPSVVSTNEKEAILEAALYKLKFESIFFQSLKNDIHNYNQKLRYNSPDVQGSPSLNKNDLVPLNHAQFYTVKIFRKNYIGKLLFFKLSFKCVVRRFRNKPSKVFDVLEEIISLISVEAKTIYEQIFGFIYDEPILNGEAMENIDQEKAQQILKVLEEKIDCLRDYETLYIFVLLFEVTKDNGKYKVSSEYDIEEQHLIKLDETLNNILATHMSTPYARLEDEETVSQILNEHTLKNLGVLFYKIFEKEINDLDFKLLQKS